MAIYGASLQTAQVTTGNVATALDKFDSTKPNNGAQNNLGTKYYDNPTTVANPNGTFVAYKYVRYNSTANAATQAAPAAVFWTDNTFTTVTSTASESLFTAAAGGAANGIAGILLLTSATVTNAQLNGNFVWIQVYGHLAGIAAPASTAKGDAILATQADWTTTGGFSRVAAGTAPTGRVAYFAETAVASAKSDGFVAIES